MTTMFTFTPVESSGDFTCPPKDTYILELTDIGEFHEKVAFNNEKVINTQSRFTFTIVEYDYDPDFDEQDWNGTQVSDFYVFFKYDQEKKQKFNTWCHEKSKVYPLLAALIGHDPDTGESIDIQELIGRRVKATVEPKESGYPKISNPIKYRQRRPAKAEVADEPEDDEEAAKPNPFKRSA